MIRAQHHVPDARIRVLCVDDHRLVREGLVLIISRERDLEVIGSASTGEQAVAVFKSKRPDVTLMDLQLPRMSGLDAIRAIRDADPRARIIVLTMYSGDEDIYRALEAGATTYLVKDMVSRELTQIIREVHAGQQPLAPELQARLTDRANRPNLTRREVQVVELISQGMRNKEVAASLDITEETVRVHVRSIFSKLQVNDRTAAVRVAMLRGIIHLK
jgi:DNA-binding NarL/FixJ family response regulator